MVYEFKLCCSVISANLALAGGMLPAAKLEQIQFPLGHVSVHQSTIASVSSLIFDHRVAAGNHRWDHR
jgi:hypothetical protein